MKRILLLLLVPSMLHAASAGGPIVPSTANVRIRAFLTAHADAHESQLVVLEPGAETRVVTTVTHAPGMVPRGIFDGKSTWFVLADGPSKLGEPASLYRVVDGEAPQRVMGGLVARQRPALTGDGRVLVVSDDGTHERAVRKMALHAVNADGTHAVLLERNVSWMTPVPAQGVVVFMQEGRKASILQVEHGVGALRFSGEVLLRDVSAVGVGFTAVESVKGGERVVELVDGKLVPVTRGMQPIVRGTTVWSAGAGKGLATRDGAVMGAVADAITVPLDGDKAGNVILVRIDSADKKGRADGRLPAAFALSTRKELMRLATRGALLEPVHMEPVR